MLLQGSIDRFKLVGVLQFLAQNVATGVLQVHDFDESGSIYLVRGRVEGISLPLSDVKLGTHLLRAGCLTEAQLEEALKEDQTLTPAQRRLRPLGQRLVERGFASEARIREVLQRQTCDLAFELAHWQSGVFVYDEAEEPPHFQVTIQSKVQELLLDTQRRIDEGQHSRKTGQAIDNEACFACPISHECSDAIKAKYLKEDICLWRKMSAVSEESYPVLDGQRLPGGANEDVKALLSASLDWR